MKRYSSIITAVCIAIFAGKSASQVTQQESCPVPAAAIVLQQAELAAAVHAGTRMNGSVLTLNHHGARFKPVELQGIPDPLFFAAAGDFNGDGKDDLVGAGELVRFVRVYQNVTSGAGDFDDPSFALVPQFAQVAELVPQSAVHELHPLAVADFDGDGRLDIFHLRAGVGQIPVAAEVFLNTSNAGSISFASAYSAMAEPGLVGEQRWSGTSIQALDYNGDRRIDLVIGNADGDGGSLRVFLNTCPIASSTPAVTGALPCADPPLFVANEFPVSDLLLGANGDGEQPAFAFADFDGDGHRDVLSGAPNCCSTADRLRLRFGFEGRQLEPRIQALDWPGAATAIMTADFTRDGRMDAVVAADGARYGVNLGGKSWLYRGTPTADTFAAGEEITGYNELFSDVDFGVVMNYDQDPEGTPDVLLGDGQSGRYFMLANRVGAEYVECGEVVGAPVDIGALANQATVITAVKIDTDATLNGGTLDLWVSGDDPVEWHPMWGCGGDDRCVSLRKPAGHSLRWKARLCANAARSEAPQLAGLTISFDYTTADEHYRAGVVTSDGVAYVPAIVQPGDAGRFYASNAGLTQTYWEAGAKLNLTADAARRIYTASLDGGARYDLTTDAAVNSAGLRAVLGSDDTTVAMSAIDWFRSARFGGTSKLGAIVTSTPAVVPRPGIPLWYSLAGDDDRTRVDNFIAANVNRPTIVLASSKAGLIHAFRNDTTNIGLPQNGSEAWAFAPPAIARQLIADYTESLASGKRYGLYPDGSPTVADVKLADGALHTVAIIGGGRGSQSIVALDIGSSVTPTGVYGPTPLWTFTPGQHLAGQAHAKPVLVRVKMAGEEQFIAIVATGLARDDASLPAQRGRDVFALSAATGSPLWKFRAACPITSDIAAFETDDEPSLGNPEIDGYMDRVVFADACGNVYKLNPAQALSGNWLSNAGYGAIAIADSPVPTFALFSTASSEGALGSPSPIAGTIAVRSDATTRVALFFGTGGIESHAPNQANALYAVYADNGELRNKVLGSCSDGACEKFYGGVVVTSEQVIYSRTYDPRISSAECDGGRTTIEGVRLNPSEDDEFSIDFSSVIGSQVTNAIYGDAGALYFSTLGGDVVRIGKPRSFEAGGDSAAVADGKQLGLGSFEGFSLLGWRLVL